MFEPYAFQAPLSDPHTFSILHFPFISTPLLPSELLQIDLSRPVEDQAFVLEHRTLLGVSPCPRTRADLPHRVDHPMPRYIPISGKCAERIPDLTGRAWNSRQRRDLAVGRDTTARDLTDDSINAVIADRRGPDRHDEPTFQSEISFVLRVDPASRSPMTIPKDARFFQRDQSLRHPLVDERHESVDVRLRVHDLDHHREVGG